MPKTVNVDYVTKTVEIKVNDNETESIAAATAVAAAKNAKNYAASAGASANSAQTTATELAAWLEDKETLTAPAVDTTLSITGAAADAKVTGDRLDVLEDEMEHLYTPASSSTFNYSSDVITGAFVRAAYRDIREYSGFFYTNLIPLHNGEKFTISAYGGGTSVAWLSKWTSENVCESVIQTSVKNTETTFEYTATEDVEYLRFSNNETAGNYHFDVVKTTADGYASELTEYIKDISSREEISVGVGKDFESIVDAISSLDTTKKYTIYVYPGTYDTVVTADIDENYKGLIIPNNVDIIGMGNRDNIIIRGQLTNSTYATYANNISTINLTMNNHVENVTIESKNIRYCNHDDGTNTTIPGSMITAKHTFKNVKFVVDAFNDGFSAAGFCVGIGAQADKEIRFEECEFDVLASGTRVGILAHDNTANTQLRGARIYVTNSVFNIPSGYSVRLQSGGGTMDSYCYLIGNKLNNKALRYTAGTGVTTNVWKSYVRCNEGFTLSNGTSFDLTNDVVAFGNFTIE